MPACQNWGVLTSAPINQTRTFPLGHIPLNLHNIVCVFSQFDFRHCVSNNRLMVASD